jgi:hypothetical protein
MSFLNHILVPHYALASLWLDMPDMLNQTADEVVPLSLYSLLWLKHILQNVTFVLVRY